MREKYLLKSCSRNQKKRSKKEARGQQPELLAGDYIVIILENDKYKGKLLLANVKNVKNGQYYDKVIEIKLLK